MFDKLTVLLYVTDEKALINSFYFINSLAKQNAEVIVFIKKDILSVEMQKSEEKVHYVKFETSIIEAINLSVKNLYSCNYLFLLDTDVKISTSSILEMINVLNEFEKHSLVMPRYFDNESLIEASLKYMPRYTNTCNVNSGCVLLRMKEIKNLGFFDENFISIDVALNDYYNKINRFGFSSVIANHAFAKNEHNPVIIQQDLDNLLLRYPYVNTIVSHYQKNRISAIENFLPILAHKYYPKKKVLFDYITMPPFYNGTSEYQLSLLESFYELYKEKYDIYIYINHEADEFNKVSQKYSNVLYPETINGIFHLGFSATQPFYLDQHFFMNKHCLKIVYCMLDSIILRCNEHQAQKLDVDDIVRTGFKLCDGILTISDFSKVDYQKYFSSDSEIKSKPVKRVYITSNINPDYESKYKLVFDEYFLIVGNAFKHKAISQTIEVLKKTKKNFIVVGYGNGKYISDNIFGYNSGGLEESFISYLYSNCTALIFPSLYEGFGLPIVIGLKNNKSVILNRNMLNIELSEYLSEFKENFLFFDDFCQLPDIVDNNFFSKTINTKEYKQSWLETAKETEAFFDEIINTEVDAVKLNDRFNTINYMEQLYNKFPTGSDLNAIMPNTNSFFKYKIKTKFPFIFKLLKKVRNILTKGLTIKQPSKTLANDVNDVFSDCLEINVSKTNAKLFYAIDLAQKNNISGNLAITINGWIFTDKIDAHQEKVFVVINNKNNKQIAFSTNKIRRCDVAKCYKDLANSNIVRCGFVANILAGNIKSGNYGVGILVESKNLALYTGDVFQLKVKRNRVVLKNL